MPDAANARHTPGFPQLTGRAGGTDNAGNSRLS